MAGTYTVHYELAAGLNGKAKAVTDDGGPVEGEFVVTISDKPPRGSRRRRGNVVDQRKVVAATRSSNVPAVRVRWSIGMRIAALWLGACRVRLRRRRDVDHASSAAERRRTTADEAGADEPAAPRHRSVTATAG